MNFRETVPAVSVKYSLAVAELQVSVILRTPPRAIWVAAVPPITMPALLPAAELAAAAAALDSTVIDCSSPEIRILREGAIDHRTVARILGLPSIPVLRSVRP